VCSPNLEAWIRRRIYDSYLWRQWQNGHNRFQGTAAVAAYQSSEPRSAARVSSPTGFFLAHGPRGTPRPGPTDRPVRKPLSFALYLLRLTRSSPDSMVPLPSPDPASANAVVRYDPYARGGLGGAAIAGVPLSDHIDPLKKPFPGPHNNSVDGSGRLWGADHSWRDFGPAGSGSLQVRRSSRLPPPGDRACRSLREPAVDAREEVRGQSSRAGPRSCHRRASSWLPGIFYFQKPLWRRLLPHYKTT